MFGGAQDSMRRNRTGNLIGSSNSKTSRLESPNGGKDADSLQVEAVMYEVSSVSSNEWKSCIVSSLRLQAISYTKGDLGIQEAIS